MCGWARALQFGHVVVTTGVVFQFARRERVLERDIFRFGTATSVPLLVVLGVGHTGQRRPSGIDHFMMVVRVVRQARSAF